MSIKRCLLICLTVLVSHAGLACAEDLTLKVTGLHPKFRSQAPLPLELTLNWNSSDLIEGTLFIEVKDSLSEMVSVENADIAMTFGDFRLGLVLPPLSNESDTLTFKSWFVSPEWGTFDLGSTTVKVAEYWRRQLLIGLITPTGQEGAKGVYDYLDRLSLNRFRPKPQLGASMSQPKNEMDVASVRFGVEDAPRRIAAYCAYDVIVVASDALQDLKDRQRSPLLDWVDAGGSLVVDASGVVGADECDFLNELTGRVLGENAYLPGSNAKIQAEQEVLMVRRGLGRVVVTTKSPAKFDKSEALDATCWLWKVRESTKETLSRTGSWPYIESKRVRTSTSDLTNVELEGIDKKDLENLGTVMPAYAPNPLAGAARLRIALLPDSVQTIPLPLVMGVLALFLLVIAPGDWFLFGWLKKRMLTWLFFPFACVFFTCLMVFIASRYLGTGDYSTAIRFVDWGSEDRIARVNDVATLFTSASKPVDTRLTDQLFSSVDIKGSSSWILSTDPNGGTSYTKDLDRGENTLVPTLIGRPTTLYDVRLEMERWTPYVVRTASFKVEQTEELLVNWDGVQSADVFSDREALADRLRKANPDAAVVVLSGTQSSKPRAVKNRLSEFRELAISASVRQRKGFFSVVSRLAPNCDSNLEDLALVDDSNPNEATVLIMLSNEDDIIVHRRMFYRDAKGTK